MGRSAQDRNEGIDERALGRYAVEHSRRRLYHDWSSGARDCVAAAGGPDIFDARAQLSAVDRRYLGLMWSWTLRFNPSAWSFKALPVELGIPSRPVAIVT